MQTLLLDNAPDDGAVALAKTPHRVGRIALVVRDLDRVARFYQSTVGLRVIARERRKIELGVGRSVLVELRHAPNAGPRSRQDAGLFHTAFLLPSRADLGAWIAAASEQGVALKGAADHLVSEAVYLNDPEGNGVEIYVDRPSAAWIRTNGTVKMTTAPLDVDGLVAAARSRNWVGFPGEGMIGHVHLQVGELGRAEGFYSDVLGLDVTRRDGGASFFGSGGYHHQLAANVWNSRGAGVRREGAAGLAELELIVSEEALGAIRARSEASMEDAAPASLTLHDPWGLPIVVRTNGSKEETEK